MLRPSRDWRESITLSSRDPHFGQRIVSEHSVSHNNLWRQCARSTFLRFQGRDAPREPAPCNSKSGSSYAAAALGAGTFFLGFAFFSSHSTPPSPFSYFRSEVQ